MSDKHSTQDQTGDTAIGDATTQTVRRPSVKAKIVTALALVVGAVALVIGGFALGVTQGTDILKTIDPQLAEQVQPQPQVIVEQPDDGYEGVLVRRVGAAAADVRAGAIDTPSASAATEGALDGFMRSVGDRAAYLTQDEYESYDQLMSKSQTVVHTELQAKTGIIALGAFSQSSAEQVSQAIDNLVSAGATSFILDLRGIVAGDLDQGRRIASLFLNGGIFAIERTSSGTQRLEADASLHKTDAPLAVLISSDTSQTAEVVAGALQDHQRALLVGDLTAGVGSVTTMRTLSFGGALRYAVGFCTTPDGYEIEGSGITPDIIVPMDVELRDTALVSLLDKLVDNSSSEDAKSQSQAQSQPQSQAQSAGMLAASLRADGSASGSLEGDEAASSSTVSDSASSADLDSNSKDSQSSSQITDIQLKAALSAVQEWQESGDMRVSSPSSPTNTDTSASNPASDDEEA